jgi:hypothetical protein
MRPESWRLALERHASATAFHGGADGPSRRAAAAAAVASFSSAAGSVYVAAVIAGNNAHVVAIDVVVAGVLLLVATVVQVPALLQAVVEPLSRTHLGETDDSSLLRGDGEPPAAFVRDIIRKQDEGAFRNSLRMHNLHKLHRDNSAFQN